MEKDNINPKKRKIDPGEDNKSTATYLKKFTVNGGITPKLSESIFYISPEKTNQKLIKHINQGDYLMLYGHRGTGKTTRCYHAIDCQLNADCIPAYVSVQGVDAESLPIFWKSFARQFITYLYKCLSQGRYKNIELYNQIQDHSPIIDKTSFINFFSSIAGKKLVLFIDEFDLLLASEYQNILDDFLSALIFMKERRPEHYGLQSVIIMGPFSILKASNASLSPFNVSDAIESPYFTRDDTINIFDQYQTDAAVTLEPGIIDDIFNRTQGNPGLVCFCGKAIHEILMVQKSKMTTSTWLNYATSQLPNHVLEK